jgi:hypothetical protein
MLIGGSRVRIYNDVGPAKIRVYDRGIRVTTQREHHNTLIDASHGGRVGAQTGQP